MHRVTLIPGDGIGPEVAAATRRILDATGVGFDWEEIPAPPLTDVALKGPMTTPIAEGHRSLNVALRQALELYANVRPVQNLPGLKTRFDNVNLVIVRENTEGLYSGLEHTIIPGVVESLKVVTEHASLRIARYAFAYARRHHFDQVCTVHKANILKLSDGLFLDCSRRIAKEFPEIKYAELIVDNACMQLVLNPERY